MTNREVEEKSVEKSEVVIRDLGLAAFVHINGGKLLRYDGRNFVLEVNGGRTEENLRIEYLNSCCFKHDSEVMTLRKFIVKSN